MKPLDEPLEQEIDKVAKAIFRSFVLQESSMQHIFKDYISRNELEKFVKILDTAINAVWNGTTDEDEVEKKKYRTDAIYALKALGYDVAEYSDLDSILSIPLV